MTSAPIPEADSLLPVLREMIAQLENGNLQSARAFAMFQQKRINKLMTPPRSGIKGGPSPEELHRQVIRNNGLDFQKATQVRSALRDILYQIDQQDPEKALATARQALSDYESAE